MASSKLLVAAIDFGTTFSGWAFSFKNDFKTDPTKASVKQWHSGSGTLTTEKTPTVALINPDGKTLRAFGYDAENEYKDLAAEEEHGKYYYFQRFKMLLHKKLGEKLDRTVTLEDALGRSLLALDVFSLSIKYLIEDMMKVVNDRLAGTIGSEEILWVITVPAIWTDGAKQFMREAAVKAGIKTENLIIALEPEAASVFCRHLSIDTTVDNKEVPLAIFPDGTKYIVLDAGGGTIDITVHEVVPGGLKEVRSASGGGWGGTTVDNAFKTLLTDIFGQDIYERFKNEDTEDWLDLWRDFEVKKRGISLDKTAKISMKFPISLINMFEERKELKLSTAIASTKYAENVTFSGDKLKFSPSVFQNLFKESVSLTTDHLKTLMKDTSVRAILMVGGYSESPMLQHAVKITFKDVEVVIPLGASSTILRGALVYGHSPQLVKERILKYTYGVGCSRKFIAGVHDQKKLI
ncbi:heat shock 70 kDa protein 12A-like [Mercenaria mercenaria]|uniref:heat shock 70 kDa protein 12A-like n=1 Tax=Mercenaria mercenaria TaxID=6596 RepID=UPI00234E87B1|nr:heat shock 70 kDa protein 12A-like [Mercenaria mercenaria]